MATGTTLVQLRKLLNAEIEDEMDETISNAGIARKNQLLNNQQAFLANQHDYLKGKIRVSLPIVPNQQYYDLPAGIDFDHLDKPQFTVNANWRYQVAFGINTNDYNIFNSDLGVTAIPILRWDLVNVLQPDTTSKLQIQVWPISNAAQSLEFSGILKVTQMVADGDGCVIDDMALVLFTAAEILAKRGAGDAGAKLTKATTYLASLRSGKPSRFESFNISGDDWGRRTNTDYKRPVVAVGGSGGSDAGGAPSIGIG